MGSPGTVLFRERALGDVVLLGGIVASLPRPVTVVTSEAYVGLVQRMRGVDHVVGTEAFIDTSDPVVDLQANLRSYRRFPFARRLQKLSLVRRLSAAFAWRWPRSAVVQRMADAAGGRVCPPPWFTLPDARREALALVPSASTQIKRWAPERFVDLGRRWAGPVWVCGGPGDTSLVAAIADAIPQAKSLVEHGFDRTIDTFATCVVAVGGDTGLLHLAAACGAAPVALYGPTHPCDGFFHWPNGRVVQIDLPCRPCTLHRKATCHTRHHGCMAQDVSRVWEAVTQCASSS